MHIDHVVRLPVFLLWDGPVDEVLLLYVKRWLDPNTAT